MGARRSTILAGVIFLLCLLIPPSRVEANNLHLHYFETIDASLETDLFRLFTVAAQQNQQITIIAYGLDGNLQPEISVLSPGGFTLVEDRNPQQQPVAVLQMVAPESGSYPFLVRRQNDQGGMLRVMIFEGQPLSQDVVIQDTADPLLPGRAFLVAGDASAPVHAAVAVLPGTGDAIQNVVYAARGTSFTPPPTHELTQPVQYLSWVNDQTTFYTISVSTSPGTDATGSTPALQPLDFQLTINEGGEVVQMERSVCQVSLVTSSEEISVHAGPGTFYLEVGKLPAGQTVEVTGIDASTSWLQIADTSRLTGTSWIAAANANALQTDTCRRVTTVAAPLPTEAIIRNVAADPSDASLVFLVQAYRDDPVGFTAVYQQVQAQFPEALISEKKQPLLQALLGESSLTPEQRADFAEMLAVDSVTGTGITVGTALEAPTADKERYETEYMDAFAHTYSDPATTAADPTYQGQPTPESTSPADQSDPVAAPASPTQVAPPPTGCQHDCGGDDSDDDDGDDDYGDEDDDGDDDDSEDD